MSIELHADLTSQPTALRHAWRYCVGSGHAPLALRADWQSQLRQARQELGFQYVRFHGLLSDDMGTLICQSEQLLYSFFNADQICDFLLSIGMRPIIELSFMPSTLSSGGDIVFHYRGNITPPRDQAQWGELIRRLSSHWVERYGIEEVSQWYFEVWNEPNLPAFWTGGQQGYFDLYATTAKALKGVDARLRVGGPATAGNAWISEFRAYCTVHGIPVDFVSTHLYPTDAFGQIGADTTTQLEHAPFDTMRNAALVARDQADGKPLLYTEWNITSNPRDPLHDGSMAAALAVRIAMSVDDVVDAYSYWTFSDIFEENYFPSIPFHGGFGLMNLYGIKKPIYQAFKFLSMLGDRHYAVEQLHPTVRVWVGDAEQTPHTTQVLCINQSMPRHAIAAEAVTVLLRGRTGQRVRNVGIRRIDADHANPARVWHDMGEPGSLLPAQVQLLHSAAEPQLMDLPWSNEKNGDVRLAVDAAPQSLNLVTVTWEANG